MQILKRINLKNKTDLILTLALILSIAAGLYVRLKGLGKWSLALDEFYTVKSAENILKYGVPLWDSGGYYMRGILIKYITAFFLWIGFEAEYGSRLITVIANILALPPLYILSKKISGKIFATVVVFIFCFSLWEVEFARFARMYAPFQTIFLYYLLFLYKNLISDDIRTWKWLFILSFISIFIHEGGVFIIVLNFFPFIWKKKIFWSKFLFSIFLLIVSYIFLTFDFWNYNLQNVMPDDIIYEGTDFSHEGYLRIPVLLLNYISLSNILGWVFILLSGVSLVFSIRILISKEVSLYSKVILLISLIFLIINQVALTLYVLLSGLLLEWITFSAINNKKVRNLIIISLLMFIYWVIFLFTNESWYSAFSIDIISSFEDIIKKGGLILFNYPYNYYEFLMFFESIPRFTLITVISLFGVLYFTLRNENSKEEEKIRFIVLITIVSLFMVLIVNTQLSETRYAFHIFPLLFLIIIYFLYRIASFLSYKKKYSITAFIILVIIYLLISDDFNPGHLKTVDSREINFRIDFNTRETRHYYPRWDVEGVADIINKYAQPSDIIITNEPVFSYYLDRIDYFFEDYRSGRFGALTTAGGTMDRWTNANLIYTIPSLMDIIQNNNKRVWFVARDKIYFNEMPFYEEMDKYLFHKGRDESTLVLLFTPAMN